jgi:hypothetical protein
MATTEAGPVTVRRADGTGETRPAYGERELRKIVGGGTGDPELRGIERKRFSRPNTAKWKR